MGLHVLADDDPRWRLPPVEQARAAVEGGAPVVQLRAKHATDRETLAWAKSIREITRAAGALFVMNDRFDLAIAAEADAVHLGQDDMPPDRIPARFRELLAIGLSTHDPAQARAALDAEVDYLAYGPVFGTQSKETPYTRRGLDALREIVAIAGPRPVVAIGGIDASNLASLLEAGARGAAVISAVAAAADPIAATRALVVNPAWRLTREAS